MNKCRSFAYLLLNDRIAVMGIENDRSKPDKADFVHAVLDKWLGSGNSSWDQLITSLRGAGMEKTFVDEVAKYANWTEWNFL